MFLLDGSDFPTSRESFTEALAEGLRIFGPVPGATEVAGENFPRFDKLRIDLSGGRVTPDTRPSVGVGKVEPGVVVEEFEVVADPLRYEQSPIRVQVKGRDVRLDYDRDDAGRPVLALAGAADGEIELSVARADLDAILLAVAREAAAQQGVTVESVALTLRSRGPRSLEFSVAVRAAKLFMKTTVTASGQLDVDEQLDARISNATCEGSGVIGTLACGFLRPYIARYEGRPIPLMALPLGGVRLRDVTMEVGESLRLHATLGS